MPPASPVWPPSPRVVAMLPISAFLSCFRRSRSGIAVSADRPRDPEAERARQRRKTKDRRVALVEEVLYGEVQLHLRLRDAIGAAEIELLIAGVQIPVGQEEGIAERPVAQERAVVGLAREGPSQG